MTRTVRRDKAAGGRAGPGARAHAPSSSARSGRGAAEGSRESLSSPEDLKKLGQRIRGVRIDRQMTLKQMESASGLSATHLSEIERGRTSPTLGALVRIARSLHKDPAFFIESEELSEVAQTRSDQRRPFGVARGVTAETMTPGIPGGRLFAYRIRLDPEAEGELKLWPQRIPSELLYLVTRGAVECAVGSESFRLAAEDAMHASLTMAHRMVPAAGKTAELFLIISRPLEVALRPDATVRVDPPEAPAPADPSPAELGRRIKLMRVSQGLTLKELEDLGGISATHVSEIERGRASPTLGALQRIAAALGIRPAVLIEPRMLPLAILTRGVDRARLRVRSGGASLDPVSKPIDAGSLGARVLTLPVGAGPALEHQHQGEEWLTILSGAAEVQLEGTTYPLREGDTLHFWARRPHAYVNPSSVPAVMLLAHRPRLVL